MSSLTESSSLTSQCDVFAYHNVAIVTRSHSGHGVKRPYNILFLLSLRHPAPPSPRDSSLEHSHIPTAEERNWIQTDTNNERESLF